MKTLAFAFAVSLALTACGGFGSAMLLSADNSCHCQETGVCDCGPGCQCGD